MSDDDSLTGRLSEIKAELKRHNAQMERNRAILDQCRELEVKVTAAIRYANEMSSKADEQLARLNDLAAALARYMATEDSSPKH